MRSSPTDGVGNQSTHHQPADPGILINVKNQYVGDISDFEKYAILRALRSATGLPLSVCWMLTTDDASAHGAKLGYLDDPETYRHREPHVYDRLAALVGDECRDIGAIEKYGVIEEASFYPTLLRIDKASRELYFDDYFTTLTSPSLVFFDPDNGIAPDRIAPGAKDSAKFLFPAEIERAYGLGHSLVIYQHWARVNRDRAIQARFEQLRALTGAAGISVVWGRSRVGFYLVPQANTATAANAAAAALPSRWPDPEALHYTAESSYL